MKPNQSRCLITLAMSCCIGTATIAPSLSFAESSSASPPASQTAQADSLGKTAQADASGKKAAQKPKRLKVTKPVLDHSGNTRRGDASFYGPEFFGRKMADGKPMNPNSNIAASRTLPIGTTAEVVNLENGKSEIVEIRDRGPYVEGRIIDLTPKTAKKLGMHEQGVAPVVVKPIEVPLPDGSVKLGAGAVEDDAQLAAE